MESASATQEPVSERLTKNAPAFRAAYERLNNRERQQVQKDFCQHYVCSPNAFRGRLAGTHRASDTELNWLQKRVETYFQN